MPVTAYLSRRVVFPDGLRPAAVLVDQDTGRILEIAQLTAIPTGVDLRDFGNHVLMPGLVDTHVHINDPGRTDWETFRTATRAAAAGGITTVVDMPLNCLPETTTVAALEQKRNAAAGQAYVDWRPWGGAVNDNQAHLIPLAQAGVPGFKCFLIYPGCDGLGLIDETALRTAMPLIAATALPLLVHAELAAPLAAASAALANADWRLYETYLGSRPDLAEVEAVALMIRLCREFGTHVHIVHVSSAACLPLLRAARAEELPITAETCPHYLYFAAEDIADGATEFKCAPPIRSRANQQLLWQALADGTLDLVASDHSPCPPAMKHLPALGGDGDFARAWGGISSLSVSVPALWTAMQRNPAPSLNDLARWMSTAPAALAGLSARKGQIAAGFDADLVVFDPEASFTVTPEHLHFLHPVSPYLGETLQGVVRETILRGRTIFRDGVFPEPATGREARP